MEKAIALAEKVYYVYSKLPNFLKKVIKFFYWILKGVYRLLRKVYHLFVKKKKVNNSISENKVMIVENILEEGDYIVERKLKKGKYKISWIIPRPIKGSGGHRNFYRVIRYLASQGHDVTVYIDYKLSFSPDPCTSGKQAHNFIKENFFDLGASIIYGTDNIEKCDMLVATHYESAYIVKENEDKAKKCFYFIQDYESYFTAMGDEFIRAYQSYKLGLYPITSGPWPLTFLKRDFGVNYGYYFRFPLNREVYYYNGETKEKNSIVLCAKPNMPRRCYKLGLKALTIVKEKMPETKIYFFGENSSSYCNVPFDFVACGLVPTIEELGDLYRKCLVGLAFSTTNPSLVPFEMLSCGTAVVDLDFNDNEVNYGSRDNITLAEPFADKIAEKVIELLKDEKLRSKKVKNGMEFCKIFPSEKEMCEGIEKEIIRVTNSKEKKVGENK